ncbi:MAG: hypothetical protein ACYS80_07710, partial [Planctomycetota bacterium]
IENSMFKTMRELERLQMLRKLEEEAAEEQSVPAIPSTALRIGPKVCGFEAATRAPIDKEVNLKKQSQFAPALMGVNSFVGKDYENKPACGVHKNKAKQTCPEQRRMEPICRPSAGNPKH